MNNPPPPEPPPVVGPYYRGRPCPNCGEANPQDAPYCRRCGARLRVDSSGPSLLLVLLFTFIGVPCFLFGTCSILVSAPWTPGNGPSSLGFAALGLLAIGLAVLLFYLAFLRKKK